MIHSIRTISFHMAITILIIIGLIFLSQIVHGKDGLTLILIMDFLHKMDLSASKMQFKEQIFIIIITIIIFQDYITLGTLLP